MLAKDAKDKGWIALPRSLFTESKHSPITRKRPFTEFEAEIWLLTQANYAESQVGNITVKPGQILTSTLTLGKIWRWSEMKAYRFLVGLEKEGWIERHPTRRYTLITLSSRYNQREAQRETKIPGQKPYPSAQRETQRGTQRGHKKNTKNTNKEENNIYPTNFEQFWSVYPRRPKGRAKLHAYILWIDCISEGYASKDIIAGAWNYARHVALNGVEEEHIELPKDFLHRRLFLDYLDEPDKHDKTTNSL